MRIFNTISIEIGSLCNRKCWFCPNAYYDRPNEFLPMDLIRKVANELKEVNYKGRVVLYQYNEPLMDTRLPEIIKLFRGKVPRSCIMIATNGDYIKCKEDIEYLYAVGLNQLQVNIYSNFDRFVKLQLMFEQIKGCTQGNIYSYASPKSKIFSLEEKYDKQLTPASRKIGRFELTSRCGLVPGLPVENKQLNKLCPRPFRFLQINWKGDIVLCCNDFNAQHICGSIKDSNVFDAWENSTVLNHYRKTMLATGRRTLPFCNKCGFTGAYPHVVKPLWKELL